MSDIEQSAPARPRLAFVDAARSLAMLLMIQAHVADNLLLQAAKQTSFFQHYWLLRGLTAPLFFTISGFAFVVASDSHWEDYGRPSSRLFKRLRRIGSLLLIGTFLQVPRWSGRTGVFPFDLTTEEWRYVLRTGVLHCVALSLLVAYLLIAVTRNKRSFTKVAALLAVGTVVAAPFVARMGGEMPLVAEMLLRSRHGSLFPLFPFLAHFFIGATLGRLWLDVPWFARSARRLGLVLASGGLALSVGGAVWRVFDPTRLANHADWISDPSLFMSRAGYAWLIFAAMALLLGAANSPRWLKSVSANALSVYVLHLVVLYGAPGMPGLLQRFGPNLGLVQTFVLGPSLMAFCGVAMAAFDRSWDWGSAAVAGLFQREPQPPPSEPAPAPGLPEA